MFNFRVGKVLYYYIVFAARAFRSEHFLYKLLKNTQLD